MAVQQIKIFKGLESEIPNIESEVNEWLAQTPYKILTIAGNIAPQSPSKSAGSGSNSYLTQSPSCPSDVMIIVTYQKE